MLVGQAPGTKVQESGIPSDDASGNGDLSPRPECAELWMSRILKSMKQRKITLLIGQYSQKYFLQERRKLTLTETVKNWREYQAEYFVLPHPSPRNNIWLKKNPWFEKDVLPALRKSVGRIIRSK